MTLEIIGHIYLSKFDHDLEEVHRQLLELYKPKFEPHQKIVVVHDDHEYFFPGTITGVTTHNFFKLVRHVDIPLSALVILTTHSRYKESIECFISHDADRPEVHSLIMSPLTWSNIVPWINNLDKIAKDIKFNGLCMLGTTRSHRIKLGQFLNLHNFDTIQYSYNNSAAPMLSNSSKEINVIDHRTSKLGVLGLIYTFPHRTNQGWADISKNNDLEFLSQQPVPESTQNTNIPSSGILFYNQYAVDIVVETNFDYPHIFISEKTLRALLTKTPFVMFGPSGTLSYLQSFGFETFNDIWDESYDTIEDPQARFIACTKIVKEIAEWPLEKAREVCCILEDRLDRNQKTLLTYIDKTFKPVYNKFKVPLLDDSI